MIREELGGQIMYLFHRESIYHCPAVYYQSQRQNTLNTTSWGKCVGVIKCSQTESPVLDILLSRLALGSVWRNLPMLQLCLTWQLPSQGLSIIHIHESNVRELLGAELAVKQLQGFFSPSPFLLDIFGRMSCLSLPIDRQPMKTNIFRVEIREK